MTIKELKEMIKIMDYDGICAEMEKHGFRQGGENGVWEFDLLSIQEQSGYQKYIIKKDKKTGKHFVITLYKDCTAYEGLTFVDIHCSKIKKIKWRRIPIPNKMMIFTDAPINEEYLREINSIVKCDLCGEEYVKKQLLDYEGKRLCGKCFCITMNREFAQELVDAIQNRTNEKSLNNKTNESL